jgi:hypothetical protein
VRGAFGMRSVEQQPSRNLKPANVLRARRAASREMQHQEYEPHDQYDVDETCGYVESEKSKQPENNQNCGECPKHKFSSLFLCVIPAIRCSQIVLRFFVRGESLHAQHVSCREGGGMFDCGHLRAFISQRSLTRLPKPACVAFMGLSRPRQILR